jgi:hypothetical protein
MPLSGLAHQPSLSGIIHPAFLKTNHTLAMAGFHLVAFPKAGGEVLAARRRAKLPPDFLFAGTENASQKSHGRMYRITVGRWRL